MLIAGDEDCLLLVGERNQVVVACVSRSTRRRRRIGGQARSLAEQPHEGPGLVFGDPPQDLPVSKRSFQLGEERLRDKGLELAGEPARDDLGGRFAFREEGGDEDVRVADSSHI